MQHKKYLFFTIFFLIIALALRYFWYEIAQKSSEDGYTQIIQQNVQKELEIVAQEAQQIKKNFQENNYSLLVDLSKKQKYHFYIFKNKKMIFWSDHRFVPDYKDIAGNYKNQFFTLLQGDFIVFQDGMMTGGNSEIQIFIFIPVYQKFDVENAYLKSSYNQNIIPNPEIRLSYSPNKNKKLNIAATDASFLFAVQSAQKTQIPSKILLQIAVLFGILGAITLGFQVNYWYWKLKSTGHYRFGVLLLILYLLAVRIPMLEMMLPFDVIEWELFNPKHYASSYFAPNLGDFFLNTFCVLMLMFNILKNYHNSRTYLYIVKKLPYLLRYGISLVLVSVTYLSLYGVFYVMSTVYLHSQIVLDISQNIDLSYFKVVFLLVFAMSSIIFFIVTNIVVRIFIRINKKNIFQVVPSWLGGTLIYVILSHWAGIYYIFVVIIGAIYFLVALYLLLPKYLYRFRYLTSIYLFLASFVCASVGTYAIYVFGENRIDIEKKKYAETLLEEKDPYTEFILEEAHNDINKDENIKQIFLSPFQPKQLVRQRIRRYLSNTLEKYQTQIHIFDVAGKSVDNPTLPTFLDFSKKYNKEKFKTDKENTYFVSENNAIEAQIGDNILKEYLNFIEIRQDSIILGYVIIDLKQAKHSPNNLTPELLIKQQYRQGEEFYKYDYAIYVNNRISYSRGNYNYEKDFSPTWFNLSSLYEEGLTIANHKHFAMKLDDNQQIKQNKQVIISSDRYTLKNIFANFSLLFLILALIVFILVLLYAMRNRYAKMSVNFSTRIQIYLNIAFFLPLIVVSIITLSLFSASYEQDLSNNFINKAESVSNSINADLQRFQNQQLISKEQLSTELNSLSAYAQADLNLFDTQGHLIASSQPAIYDNNILSKLLNPLVYASFIEQKEKSLLLSESIGLLNYKTVYVAVRSFDNNALLGILSVPFFDSEEERDKKIINILATIINIFTGIFIIFLVVSYFASRLLTVPLQLITQKIRKTSLNKYNEPLVWASDDEIGLLVGEYNRMLVHLEDSKEALSRSEKESAWREMAKQVAHEIKNPLTPMKLTLQHLQMKINRQDSDLKNLIEKPFATILTQIDTLSDIASSFASFAKMPIPKSEDFDIAKNLHKIIDLHKENNEISILSYILDNSENNQKDNQKENICIVRGDEQLTGQIFNNLIINAIQAIQGDKKPQILVYLKITEKGFARVQIQDNGSGIDEEIQSKVFMPNFSTKTTGSGIGLALAKRGIEHAGGQIWFETVVGKGTSFFVELPLSSLKE